MGAIFILLAVGALIGTWNMAGTIPTVVHYGVALLNPTIYFACAVICALVGMVTGSSWTTVGTLGVAFIGMAKVLGLNDAVAAGAIISGAYFGDKMTPLSETTILVPSLVGGVTVNQHIRNMYWTAGPALGISLIIFLILGFTADPTARRAPRRRSAPSRARSTSPSSRCSRCCCSCSSRSGGSPRSSRSWRRRCSPASSPASRSGTPSGRSSMTRASARRHGDQGDLRGDGHRVREQLRERGYRHVVLQGGWRAS